MQTNLVLKKNRNKTKLVPNVPTSSLANCLTFKANAWVHARLLDYIES